MVSLASAQSDTQELLRSGLTEHDSARVMDALAFVKPIYAGKNVSAGQDAFESEQDTFEFAQGVASVLSELETDADTRIAALLFELATIDPEAAEKIEERFGCEVNNLVLGVRQLMRLHEVTFVQHEAARSKNAAQEAAAQLEVVRKMLLAMASDMRVVLVRLGTRVTTLRYFADNKVQSERAKQYARETFDLYAPLANRLGVWQLKWELEDLSFRFLQPEAYKRIASQLEEKRVEREAFVANSIKRLQSEMAAAGIKAEVFGRPKHIFSIWSKLRGKALEFSDLYDVRAFRVIVDDVKTATPYSASFTTSGPRYRKNSTITSRARNRTVINPCIPSLSRKTDVRWKCKCVPVICTTSQSMAWRRTGVTRKPVARISPARSMMKKLHGCGNCWRGKAKWLIPWLVRRKSIATGWKNSSRPRSTIASMY